MAEVYTVYLFGGFNHLETYKLVNGKDYPIYYGNKINVTNHQPDNPSKKKNIFSDKPKNMKPAWLDFVDHV